MKTVIEGIKIYYNKSQQNTFDLIQKVLSGVVSCIRDDLKTQIPYNTRIYVMDNWIKFYYQVSSLIGCILFTLFLPFIYKSVNRVWEYCAGWAMRIYLRPCIGIKNVRLYKKSELGERLYYPGESKRVDETYMKKVVAHELGHICLSYRKVPRWFDEGMAELFAEKCVGYQLVRQDTLDLFQGYTEPFKKKDALRNYVVGYWVVKFLYEKSPATLNRMLSLKNVHKDPLVKQLNNQFNNIRDVVVEHYKDDKMGEVSQ